MCAAELPWVSFTVPSTGWLVVTSIADLAASRGRLGNRYGANKGGITMGILKVLGSIPEHLNLVLAFACGVFLGVSKILIILHFVVLTREQRENDHMEIVFSTFLVATIATVAGSISAWDDHFAEWMATWTVGLNVPFVIRGITTMIQDRRILREIRSLRTQLEEKTSKVSDRSFTEDSTMEDPDSSLHPELIEHGRGPE